MPFLSDARRLAVGDAFPALSLDTTDGETLSLPVRDGRWTVVLVYRGEW